MTATNTSAARREFWMQLLRLSNARTPLFANTSPGQDTWIDAGAGVSDLGHWRANPLGEHHCRALDAVAKAGDLDACLALHRSAEHGHRVGIVEHGGVRAVAFHILGDAQHHRDGAQGPEDARRPTGIANIYIDTILLGDLDVITPDLRAAR